MLKSYSIYNNMVATLFIKLCHPPIRRDPTGGGCDLWFDPSNTEFLPLSCWSRSWSAVKRNRIYLLIFEKETINDSVYFRLRRRIDWGRMRRLSMSQTESSPSPTALKIKLTEIESPAAWPVFNRAVKKPFFPSKEYSPFSIVCK